MKKQKKAKRNVQPCVGDTSISDAAKADRFVADREKEKERETEKTTGRNARRGVRDRTARKGRADTATRKQSTVSQRRRRRRRRRARPTSRGAAGRVVGNATLRNALAPGTSAAVRIYIN